MIPLTLAQSLQYHIAVATRALAAGDLARVNAEMRVAHRLITVWRINLDRAGRGSH